MADYIVSAIFDDTKYGDFFRLCRAFEYSAKANTDAEVVLMETTRPPETRNYRRTFKDNTLKLGLWSNYVNFAEDGDRIVLMDCDTLVLRDVFDAFDTADFDVAYTVRNSNCRINAGVVFINVNDASREFMRRWVQINGELMDNLNRLTELAKTYAGVNQSAIAVLLKDYAGNCRFHELPCAKWNNVDQTWESFDDSTYVLHIKGALRELLLANTQEDRRPHYMKRAFNTWMEYDARANSEEPCPKAQANTDTA